jgi:RNA polymerase sigma-70 factor (ECF subfamily)
MHIEAANTRTVQRDIIVEMQLLEKPDNRLVNEAVSGSSSAFEILFERYQRKMFRVALRLLRNREDAEDAVQEAFERAFVHLKTFQGQSRFSTWLTRIAINEALALLRKRRREHAPLEGIGAIGEEGEVSEIADSGATPEQRCEHAELHGILNDAIGSLNPILRRVVYLHEISEMTTGKTAEVLGVAEGTVKARVFRARRNLYRDLSERLGIHGRKARPTPFRRSRDERGQMRKAALVGAA